MTAVASWDEALAALLEASHVDDVAGVDLMAVVIRWTAKIDFAGPLPDHRPELGPCWLWTGASNPRGYGKLNVATVLVGAHRVGLALSGVVLPPPTVLEVDHLCLRQPCVRASHLELVTHAENVRRHYDAQGACLRGHPRIDENVHRDAAGRIKYCKVCRREKRAAGAWS